MSRALIPLAFALAWHAPAHGDEPVPDDVVGEVAPEPPPEPAEVVHRLLDAARAAGFAVPEDARFPETVDPALVRAILEALGEPPDAPPSDPALVEALRDEADRLRDDTLILADPQFPERPDPVLIEAIHRALDTAPPTEVTDPISEAPPPPLPSPLRTITGAHGADAQPREARPGAWDTSGELRGRVNLMTDPALDPQGTRSGRSLWLTSRLIAGVTWRTTEHSHVELELEALNGTFAGGTTDVGTGLQDDVFRVRRADYRDLTRIVPRKLAIVTTFPKAGQLRVGAQLFTWGTGLLANDGRGDPDFGDANTGSVVARASFATAPWRNRELASLAARGTTFFVAADVVIRDDNASLFEGDLAAAGVAGFRVQHGRFDVGGFGVARWQRDRRDPFYPSADRATTLAFPIDLYAKVLLTPVGADQRLILEGEAAYITGRTTRPWTDETFTDGARIASFGGVARLRYDHDPLRLTLKVETGFASGDDDLRDDVVRTFSFHSDFNVGMLLFEELLPLVTARAVDQGSDPNLLAVPSAAARFTVNQGTVTNAVYVFPVIRWRPVKPVDLRAGYVAAWSAGDFVDVYESGIRGGYNATPGGVVGGARFLGHEIDLSARTTLPLPHGLAIEIGAEGAVFLPGAAFDGVDGDRLDTQWLGRARLTFLW